MIARTLGDEELRQLIEQSREHQQALYIAALGSNDPEKIGRALQFADSGNRLPLLIALTADAPAEVFWPVFLDWFSTCDATWNHRRALLQALRKHGDGIAYLEAADRAFYDALPERVCVFRGCSAARVKGASWTTTEAVARGFARGHRMIPVPQPVLAVAEISKRRIFAVATARGESEVILDPAALKVRSVAPFV